MTHISITVLPSLAGQLNQPIRSNAQRRLAKFKQKPVQSKKTPACFPPVITYSGEEIPSSSDVTDALIIHANFCGGSRMKSRILLGPRKRKKRERKKTAVVKKKKQHLLRVDL